MPDTDASASRVLWLSHFVPFPPKGGCFQRSYNLLKRVAATREVHLVAMRHKSSTHPEEETRTAREELLNYCRTVEIVDISQTSQGLGSLITAGGCLATATPFNVAVYRSERVRQLIRNACREHHFDIAHFDTIGLAQYLPDIGNVPAIVTHHGAESHMIRRRMRLEPNWLKRAFFVFEWLALRRYERRMCPRFGANVVMSDDDGALMRCIASDAVYETVPNGVDLHYFVPGKIATTPSIVFAGRLDQYSNRDGLLHFLHAAWPILSQTWPEATIDVIGANPPTTLSALAAADPRIRVRGFVPDVRPFFRSAAAAICPVRDGGGTRIKVLDALAQGTPLVSTSIGCEGIEVIPERHVLIADTPEAFARQFGRLFSDATLRHRLAADGRRLIEERYSWEALGERLQQAYDGSARRWMAANSGTRAVSGRARQAEGNVPLPPRDTAGQGPTRVQ